MPQRINNHPFTAQPKNTFTKAERLYLKKDIDELFARGQAFVAYPLRVVYLLGEEPRSARCQILVTSSKRYFKRANKRNRFKRLMREGYRLSKHAWLAQLEERGLFARMALMGIAKELPSYSEVEGAIHKTFKRIAKAQGWEEIPPSQEP